MTGHSRVIALAGRRIDPPGAQPPRFPLSEVGRVRQQLRELLVAEGASALVASAACGADLIALDEAAALGIRCRIVLSGRRGLFRAHSVVTRPGDWGPVFDRAIDRAGARGDLIELPRDASSGWAAFVAANHRIVDEACRLAPPDRIVAVLVWEGASRGDEDATAEFGAAAAARGIRIVHVPTR